MKLRPSPDSSADSAPIDHPIEEHEDDVPSPSRAVRCATCDAVVARLSDRVERFGAREHDRVNPAGFAFRIACFARADGARPIGPPSTEFAWFPRAPWRVVLCGACGVHLGWWFGGDAPFFGLNLAAIVEGA